MPSETCSRCCREVDLDDEDYSFGEAIEGEYVCRGCVTPAEEQALDEDFMARGDEIARDQEWDV